MRRTLFFWSRKNSFKKGTPFPPYREERGRKKLQNNSMETRDNEYY